MGIASNWKLVILLIQLGLLAMAIATGNAIAGDPVDNPFVP